MAPGDKELIDRAKKVLESNWTGGCTKPAPDLYPHQWNWDSGFIAIGYAHFDQQKAQQELSTLFDAQWANGMVPQVVFNPEALGGYFPEPDFWQCERSPDYPKGKLTSGITMPPVHAIAARRIYEFAEDKEAATAWLREIYPKILASHEYLHRDRDPRGDGLVYIRHPWESGRDNSPTWDKPLNAFEIDRGTLPDYDRKDLHKGVPSDERPTDDDYDRYVYLVDLFRRNDYDEEAIYDQCPFLLYDPLFNSILSKADEDLAFLGRELGEDVNQLLGWHERANAAMRRMMWHSEERVYDVFDLRAEEAVGTITVSGFMPLLCGAPDNIEAKALYSFLESNSFCSMHDDSCFSIPDYDLDGASFDNKGYWRGPVWINTNWLIMHGLRRYGFDEKAASVREDIIELVRRWGFHEYFDPFEGNGYGTDYFSWTAALFLDVMLERV